MDPYHQRRIASNFFLRATGALSVGNVVGDGTTEQIRHLANQGDFLGKEGGGEGLMEGGREEGMRGHGLGRFCPAPFGGKSSP